MKSFFLAAVLVLVSCQDTPAQVHLAVTGNPTQMQVSWVTNSSTATSTVKYGVTSQFSQTVTGSSDRYELPLFYTSPYLHTATLTSLLPNQEYFYQVGDEVAGWSSVFSFASEDTDPVTPEAPLNLLIFSDNGAGPNSQMVLDAAARQDAIQGYNLLLMSGDLSYANGEQNIWDQWGAMIEPLASHVPFMFSTGNHEAISLFVPFDWRFNMPQNGYYNEYYSYNYRSLHVLVLNSESFDEFHWSDMYQFALADLKAVDRSVTPWLIVMFHHPFYCSNTMHEDSNWFMLEEYEATFLQYSVDLVLQGHVHAYERCGPIYQDLPNPQGPYYITNGMGGNEEGLYPNWISPSPPWSLFRLAEYGFSSMTIINASHAEWTMRRANDSKVMDQAFLVRDRQPR